ncbi:MAG: dihydroxyacetone kinase subunit DhaL [Eubacteriales bacterium]|nr:dihydroxyacetone kinase subunit DhaL [Eubacteriales bacterium]
MLRKLINTPSYKVEEMLEGYAGAFPDFYELHPQVKGILYKNRRKGKVVLVCGGGAGHEPMSIGFVGQGLADAAICGNLYNSPDADSIYQVAKAAESGKGILFLYGNYMGDKMNFDAAEKRLKAEGIAVGHFCVHDDIASAPVTKKEERRGIVGGVFLYRIAGAASDAGMELEEILALLEREGNRVWSVGAAITDRHRDIRKSAADHNSEKVHVEYGIGLHGECGILSMELSSADELVDKMYSQIMDEADIQKDSEVCVLVNGLGSISYMELSIVFRRVKQLLEGDGIKIYDADMDNYCSSYEAEGFSLALFKISDEIKKFYNAPCYSPCYHHRVTDREREYGRSMAVLPRKTEESDGEFYKPAGEKTKIRNEITMEQFRDMMLYMAKRLIGEEEYLSELDSIFGDGDHGICIANGMRRASKQMMTLTQEQKPEDVCEALSTAMMLIGGASGVFYGTIFKAAARTIEGKRVLNTADFAEMWGMSLAALMEKGHAQKGDKTMVDALAPAAECLAENKEKEFPEILSLAEKAAKKGMLNTKKMAAKFGRGKFLTEKAYGCQDAGATTIWIMFRSMREYLEC